MDYTKLWERWIHLCVLSETDRKALMNGLHDEVITGTQTLTVLALAEIKDLLQKTKYHQLDASLETVAPILTLSALDGYLFSLMVQGLNPETANLKQNAATQGLVDQWSNSYQQDKNVTYVEQIDPIVSLMVQKISELRMNQVLALFPDIVKLPYVTTGRLLQYFGWLVQQGYVLGCMENS